MKTVIKENINFKLNDSNTVDVIKENRKISEIDLGLHTILCLFNGYFENTQIIDLFGEVFNIDRKASKERFETILRKCKYILEENDELKRELKPFVNKKIDMNFNRIRSIVPEGLTISLTKDCFMKCRYCYAGANYSEEAREENSLPLEFIEKIVKEAKDLNIELIFLTGGDPFARKDIFEILDIFKTHNINIGISTKKHLTDEEINKLKEYQSIIPSIQISLDSLYDEIQEQLVFKKKFSTETIELIKKLIHNNFKVSVNSVLTSVNISSIFDLIPVLDNLGVDTWVGAPYQNNLWREDISLFPSLEQYGEFLEKIGNINTNMTMDYYKVIDDVVYRDKMNYINKPLCKGGLSTLIISPHGHVSMCERMVYHEEYSVGNIKDYSLIELWNSPKLKLYTSPNIEQFKGSKCYDCEHNNTCVNKRGICYVHSLILNNEVFSSDYCGFCETSKRVI